VPSVHPIAKPLATQRVKGSFSTGDERADLQFRVILYDSLTTANISECYAEKKTKMISRTDFSSQISF